MYRTRVGFGSCTEMYRTRVVCRHPISRVYGMKVGISPRCNRPRLGRMTVKCFCLFEIIIIGVLHEDVQDERRFWFLPADVQDESGFWFLHGDIQDKSGLLASRQQVYRVKMIISPRRNRLRLGRMTVRYYLFEI